VNIPLGQQIKRLRKEAGLSQQALAEEVGISKYAICRIERGRGNPSLSKLMAIAEILKVDITMDSNTHT
jgi:transcriptional regulator with XRE-family HTH domain